MAVAHSLAFCLMAALALAARPASLAAAEQPELARYSYNQVQMGIAFRITLYAADEATANTAADAAFARIDQLNSILSDYDPRSELSQLSSTAGSGKTVPVSDPLWFMLKRSQHLARQTDGAFDITVGPLIKLWRRARRMKAMPSPERLAEARQAVGYRHLELDKERQAATLHRPGMRLDLGGIAVGYAVDEALKVLQQHGIRRTMVDGSGDIGLGDPPPGEQGWTIGVAPLDPEGPPSVYVSLANYAITTSGDAFQYVEIDGKRYSHIVDPKTGLGLSRRSAVTVIAPDCTTADSLATAVSVLGPEAGLKLVEATPGAAAIIVVAADGRPQKHVSRRLVEFLADGKTRSRDRSIETRAAISQNG